MDGETLAPIDARGGRESIGSAANPKDRKPIGVFREDAFQLIAGKTYHEVKAMPSRSADSAYCRE